MLTVIFLDNPFDPFLEDARSLHLEHAASVRDVLNQLFTGFIEFEHPTLCLVNGQPYLRIQWDLPIPQDATVTFVRLAQGIVEVIIAVVILIVAVVVALTVVKKQNLAAIGADDQTQRNGDPVYTLSGQQNQVRLNSAIECAYGRNRIFPAYAAIPYNKYEGNEQYQYSLFSLGHGSFNIEINQCRFEDTPISKLQDVKLRIYPPGTIPTLVASRVSTSATVSNIEMLGRNQDGYRTYPVAYTVNEPGTETNKIEVDVSLPGGLYMIGTDGKLEALEVKAKFEYQKIDNNGAALGAWTSLFNFKQKLKELTPRRYTLSTSVPLGRYQVRGRRTNDKKEITGASDSLQWEVLRCFIPSVTDFGDVTLIAIKARATNQLNNNAAQRFNLVATRLLPIWISGVGWSAPTATRNPIWAFCDVFRATYGARLSSRFLDLVDLRELADYYEAGATHFDYIFDQKSTVWEAAKTIARVGRGIPMLNGSLISIVRDQPRATATAVFNQHNILAGSFEWDIKLPTLAENDGIEVEYVDETTWVAETVLCLLGKDKGVNPELLRLPGCTDRSRAFQEGLYHRAVQLYIKESITFKTGLEGHLPSYGALILVNHDVPRWGSGGMVKSIEITVDDTTLIELNNPVTFLPATEHRIILRRKNGSAYGPVACFVGLTPYFVEIDHIVNEEFNFNEIQEAPFYLFGVENEECRRCIVVGITPEGEDVVGIKCVPYDERIFSFIDVPTPARYTVTNPISIPDSPEVGVITVSRRGSPDLLTVYWPPSLGALYYTVETSLDNISYTLVATVTQSTTVLPTYMGPLWIRVSAWNVAQGPYAYWTGDFSITNIPLDIDEIYLVSSISGSVTVGWSASTYATTYVITVYSKSTRDVLRTWEDNILSTDYTLAMGTIDGLLERDIFFRVRGKNASGVSENAAELSVHIPGRAVEPPPIGSPLRTGSPGPRADSTLITADRVVIP